MDVLGSRQYGICGCKAALKKKPRRGLKRTVDLGCLIAGWIALLLSCSITLAFLDAGFVTVPHAVERASCEVHKLLPTSAFIVLAVAGGLYGSEFVFNVALRPQRPQRPVGTGSPGRYLDFQTVPELWRV